VRGSLLVEDEGALCLNVGSDGALAELTASAACFPLALGPQAGRWTMTLRVPDALSEGDNAHTPSAHSPLTTARDTFPLNAYRERYRIRPSRPLVPESGVRRGTHRGLGNRRLRLTIIGEPMKPLQFRMAAPGRKPPHEITDTS